MRCCEPWKVVIRPRIRAVSVAVTSEAVDATRGGDDGLCGQSHGRIRRHGHKWAVADIDDPPPVNNQKPSFITSHACSVLEPCCSAT